MAVSTVLIASMFFSLKAVVPGNDGSFAVEIKYLQYTPYIILMAIITILNILALTSYRFRVFQMRTAVLSAIITAAFQAWLAVDYFTAGPELVFRYTAVFPIVSMICDLMAARGIASDIMVAESVNHLRASRKNRRRK